MSNGDASLQDLPFHTDTVLESLPDGFQAFDRQWRYVYVNARAEQILGRSREELLGKVCWEEYPEAVGTPFHARYLEAMAGDKTVVFEEFCPHEETWAEFSLHPWPNGLAAFQRDITARKRAEEESARALDALSRSQAELEDFFENSPVGLHWVDSRGIIVRANRAEMELLGYSAEEFVGRPIAAFHADADTIEDILRRLGAGQELHEYPARLRCKDGSLRHVLISSNVRFRDGEFLHTRCFTRDVTDRHIAQAERERASREARIATDLRASQEALRASEERFRLLVEQVQDYAIFMLDPDGHIATWNVGAQRIKGYSASEIIGQHFSRFYTREDIDRRHPWHELEIAAREGRYEEEGWRIRKDGSQFWANVVITALRDSKGSLCGFAKVTRDMTERRRTEQQKAAAEAAEQQRRFLRDVLSSVTQGRLVLCEKREELPVPPGTAASTTLLTRESLRTLRQHTEAAALACGLSLDRRQDLLTAVGEAGMNAVVHAGGGTARVFGNEAAGRVQVWVEDRGRGIELSTLPRATLELGFSSLGTLGHGFWLMLQTCDRVYLLTGPDGTTVVIDQGNEAPLPPWLQGTKPKV